MRARLEKLHHGKPDDSLAVPGDEHNAVLIIEAATNSAFVPGVRQPRLDQGPGHAGELRYIGLACEPKTAVHTLKYSEAMATPVTGLWTVLLAAGGSTRFGSPKQLLRLRGQVLIRRAADLARAVTPGRVVVVVGAAPFRLRSALYRAKRRIRVVDNPHWRDGMSGSLRRGLRALPRSAAAALILAVDQPLITALELRRLIAAWSQRPSQPAASAYAGRVGIPAILPRRAWVRAARAHGDTGARELLRQPGLMVTAIQMPEAAIDIDTHEDLDRLSSMVRTRVNPFRRASRLAR